MTMTALEERLALLAEQWRAMPRSSDEERRASARFYEEDLFPLIRETFVKRESAKIKKEYNLAIMTAGGSPEALILSLSVLKPKQVYFLYTAWRRSLEGVDQVVEALRLKPSQFDKRQIDPDDTLDTYTSVKAAIEWAGNPSHVVVDISGGKKSMSVAAGLAAYVIGAGIVYVDNTEFWQPFGKPKPGSEFLALLSHPYTVFGDLARREAERFYRAHDYTSAERIFARLAEDVPTEVNYLLWQHLAAAYRAWDRFNLPLARREMDALVKELERRQKLEPQLALLPYLELLRTQVAVLQRLQPLTGHFQRTGDLDLSILQNQEQVVDLVFSLYTNAKRREDEIRLDLAALLLYRVLEMLAQRRLALLSIDTKAPDYCQLPQPVDTTTWQESFQRLFNRTPRGELPGKLGLVDSYVLLAIQKDPLIQNLDWGRLQNAITARNRSILAHGFQFLSQKAYEQFCRVVDGQLVAFCQAEGLSLDALLERYRFVQPFGA